MRKLAARVALTLAAATVVILVAASGFAILTRREPAFYADAVIEDPQQLETLADEVVRRWSQAANAVQSTDEPFAIALSDRQINAWLQRDLMERVGALVPELREAPRVRFSKNRFWFGIATELGTGRTVLSFEGTLWLAPDGRIAIRVDHVRAGAAPLPTRVVLGQLADALAEGDLELELRELDGATVVLFSLPESDAMPFELLDLRIHEGKLYIAGTRRPEPLKVDAHDALGARSVAENRNSHDSAESLWR